MGSKRIGTDDSSAHDLIHTMATIPPHLRYARRLSDKILIAFHHACDQRDIKVAAELLGILDFMGKRPTQARRDRRSEENLVAAHERLWLLRHPDLLEC
jgi:hypothetical protein